MEEIKEEEKTEILNEEELGEDRIIKAFISAYDKNKLYVDSREPPKIFKYLEQYGLEYEKTLLPIGDFVCGNICIERKEIADFVQSIRSGHLKKQVINMQNNFKNCYLIISGDPKTVFMNPYIKNWTTNHHLGAMISLLVHFNLKIQQTENSSQLINAVSKIIKKSQDGKSPSIFDTELMMIKASDLDIKTKMLMCLPLIGKEKGQKLSEKLDIRIIRKDTGMLIDEKNFPWIEGIGDKTIEEIVKINRKDTPIPAPLIVNKGATPDPPKN